MKDNNKRGALLRHAKTYVNVPRQLSETFLTLFPRS